MNGRFFLDTNIFVYSLAANRSAKKTRAAELVDHAILLGRGVIGYQVVQEFFNLAFRRFTPRMTYAEAEQYLAITLVPAPQCAFLAVAVPGGADSKPAIFAFLVRQPDRRGREREPMQDAVQRRASGWSIVEIPR